MVGIMAATMAVTTSDGLDYPIPHALPRDIIIVEAHRIRMQYRSAGSHPSGPGRNPKTDSPPDAVLLDRARDGEATAYRALLERYRTRVAGYAYRLTGDPGLAEDVAQESFLRLWKSFATNPVEGNAGAWLHRVARNLCLDKLRRSGREVANVSDHTPDERESAEARLQSNETARRVRDAMLKLPERQRAAIVLVHYQHLSGEAAAAQLEISVEALESLLARGRRKLRETLSREKENLGPVGGGAP